MYSELYVLRSKGSYVDILRVGWKGVKETLIKFDNGTLS